MNFKMIEEKFNCILNIKKSIVAVDIASNEDEFRQMPQQILKVRLTFCMMMRLATMGHARKASAAQSGCPGASEVFGFTKPAGADAYGERLYSFGLYRDIETARQVQSEMASLSRPCSGIATMPLAECGALPQVAVFFVDAYQAMRLVQAWTFHHGPLNQITLTGNRGICSECVAKPLQTGAMHLSPLCSNTRHLAKWHEHDIGVGLPARELELLLDGLIKTIPAVEPRKQKQAILERCHRKNISLELPEKDCYFTKG